MELLAQIGLPRSRGTANLEGSSSSGGRRNTRDLSAVAWSCDVYIMQQRAVRVEWFNSQGLHEKQRKNVEASIVVHVLRIFIRHLGL